MPITLTTSRVINLSNDRYLFLSESADRCIEFIADYGYTSIVEVDNNYGGCDFFVEVEKD